MFPSLLPRVISILLYLYKPYFAISLPRFPPFVFHFSAQHRIAIVQDFFFSHSAPVPHLFLFPFRSFSSSLALPDILSFFVLNFSYFPFVFLSLFFPRPDHFYNIPALIFSRKTHTAKHFFLTPSILFCSLLPLRPFILSCFFIFLECHNYQRYLFFVLSALSFS